MKRHTVQHLMDSSSQLASTTFTLGTKLTVDTSNGLLSTDSFLLKLRKIRELHPCSAKEFEQFYEPDYASQIMAKKFREWGGLYCLDWKTAVFELQGDRTTGYNLDAIDLMTVPCGTSFTSTDGQQLDIRDDCVWDRKEVLDYHGTMQVVIYYNDIKFHSDQYGNSRLEKRSVITQQMANPSEASWFGTKIQKHSLIDDSSYLQLGTIQSDDYEKIQFEVAQPSGLHQWPTKEKKNSVYKLASFWIEFSQSLIKNKRKTYSVFERFCDIAGLFSALQHIFKIIFAPVAVYNLRNKIFQQTFRKDSMENGCKINEVISATELSD